MARTAFGAADNLNGGRVYFTNPAGPPGPGGSGFPCGSGATITSPQFRSTQGHTAVTFAVHNPTGAGTWFPFALDEQGGQINLLSGGGTRTIAAGAHDGICINCSFDVYGISFHDTSSAQNNVQSFYIAEGAAAGGGN